jgi:hypothetical protein
MRGRRAGCHLPEESDAVECHRLRRDCKIAPDGRRRCNLRDSSTNAATASNKGSIAGRDSSPEAKPNLTDDLVHPGRLDPPIVKVEGGLVIPHYVIVLSVIGGAINMTRKVPGFQKEGEDALPSFPETEPPSPARPTTGAQEQPEEENAAATQPDPNQPAADKAADDKAGAQTGAADKLLLEDQAAKIDQDLDALIPIQAQRNTDTATALPKMQALVTQMKSLFATNSNPSFSSERRTELRIVSARSNVACETTRLRQT